MTRSDDTQPYVLRTHAVVTASVIHIRMKEFTVLVILAGQMKSVVVILMTADPIHVVTAENASTA